MQNFRIKKICKVHNLEKKNEKIRIICNLKLQMINLEIKILKNWKIFELKISKISKYLNKKIGSEKFVEKKSWKNPNSA